MCLGNICRSPMAEAVFKEELRKNGLEEKVDCDSAGTAGYHIGSSPDKRTLQVLAEHGISTPHLARKLEKADANRFDYVMVMDESNYSDTVSLIGIQHSSKVFLFREFDQADSIDLEVPDPYHGTMKDFNFVYELCLKSSQGLIRYLRVNHSM